MREETTRLITIVNETISGVGSVVSTRTRQEAESRRNPNSTSERARLFLNVTALTAGTAPTMDVKVVHVIDGVDIDIASFTQSTEGASSESIVVEACPTDLKVVYTVGGTVADFDATVDCMRF